MGLGRIGMHQVSLLTLIEIFTFIFPNNLLPFIHCRFIGNKPITAYLVCTFSVYTGTFKIGNSVSPCRAGSW